MRASAISSLTWPWPPRYDLLAIIDGARRLDWAEWERPQPHGGNNTSKWFECVRLDTVAGRAYPCCGSS